MQLSMCALFCRVAFPIYSVARSHGAKLKMSFETYLPYTRVEAGSNTSTVTLRIVRGDEMGLKKAAP
jgi:hypothetical protein